MSMGGLGNKMKVTVKGQVDTAKGAAGGLGDVSLDKLYAWLEEFNNAMILLDDFGFTVSKFTVGSGLVPGVTISIVGSLDAVELDIVDKMIADNEGRKITVALMKSIRTAKTIRECVSSLPFSDVRIDITLGWPPDIALDFIDATA